MFPWFPLTFRPTTTMDEVYKRYQFSNSRTRQYLSTWQPSQTTTMQYTYELRPNQIPQIRKEFSLSKKKNKLLKLKALHDRKLSHLHDFRKLCSNFLDLFQSLDVQIMISTPNRRVSILLPLQIRVQKSQMVRFGDSEFFSLGISCNYYHYY